MTSWPVGYRVAICCANERDCGHRTTIRAEDLISRHGNDLDVQAYARGLRCSRCGTGNPTAIVFWGGSIPMLLGRRKRRAARKSRTRTDETTQ